MRQREVFFDELLKYALNDEKVVLLYGDVGGQFLDSWKESLPTRTINMMPSEQNMILVAAGLAQSGFKPFCYSIIPFLIYRPFEMIRIYMGHQELPIRLVGIGTGRSYGDAGYTHWSGNDDTVALGIPIRVRTPGDRGVVEAVRWSYESDQPCYVRLER
jgi:transketolase